MASAARSEVVGTGTEEDDGQLRAGFVRDAEAQRDLLRVPVLAAVDDLAAGTHALADEFGAGGADFADGEIVGAGGDRRLNDQDGDDADQEKPAHDELEIRAGPARRQIGRDGAGGGYGVGAE